MAQQDELIGRNGEALPDARSFKRHAKLTARQRDVARRLLTGRPLRMIAEDLVVSIETVRMHERKLLERTGMTNLRTLGIWAYEHRRCCVAANPSCSSA